MYVLLGLWLAVQDDVLLCKSIKEDRVLVHLRVQRRYFGADILHRVVGGFADSD